MVKRVLWFLGVIFVFSLVFALLNRKSPNIAIIRVRGVILNPLPIEEEIEKAQKDKNIKALVLRVDSPGGAVGAAQEIYRALQIFRDHKKPIVVSMGSLAASGGYYISVPANYIYANPGTLTASIGVIIDYLNYKDLLKKIGIEQGDIKTGKYKDILVPWKKLSKDDKAYLQYLIDNTYEQFIDAILAYRSNKISKQQLLSIADGRVLTGVQAKQLGLVDGIGNLEDAVKKAASLAHIKHPRVVFLKREKSLVKEITGAYFKEAMNHLELMSPIHTMYMFQGF
ncbi:MAG: signal peptide peptidase SppA [Hydrogenobaculum sp.]